MDPITAGAMIGVGLLTSIANIWNSAKERGESRDRLRRIEDIFNSIAPPDYDLTVMDPPQLHGELLSSPKFRKQLAEMKLDPETMKKIGAYLPQMPKLIKDKAPQMLTDTPEGKEGLEAQQKAMREFQRIAESEEDPRFRLLIERAKKRAQSEAQSRGQTLQTQMARRGLSGSGLEMAANIGSTAEAMDRMGEMEMQAAADAYRNRLEALARGADLGRSISGQERDKQKFNIGLINDFNRRMGARAQEHEYGLHRARLGERDYQNKLSEYKANWARGERDRLDRMKRNKYLDEMNRARARMGMEAAHGEVEGQKRRDYGRAIGEFGNVAIGALGMMGGGGKKDEEEYLSPSEKWRRDRYRSGRPFG